MNEFLIKQYINNLTYGDISSFASTQGITLTNEETEIIYDTIKNHWRTILYGNPRGILDDLKSKLEPHTYSKAEELYISFKEKFENYL